MARLPTVEDLGNRPSLITRAPGANIDTSASSRAVANFGNTVSKVGIALAEESEARAKADAEQRYQEFAWNEQLGLLDGKRNATRDGIDGFSNSWQEGYMDRARSFMSTLPATQRNYYEQKLFSTERSLYGDAITFQRGEQKRFSILDFGSLVDGPYSAKAAGASSPGELNQIAAEAFERLRVDPNLSPSERAELEEKAFRAIAVSYLNELPSAERRRVIGTIRGYQGGKNDALVRFESGGNPKVVNGFGYAGKFQFGAPRLQTLGVYSPGSGEGMKGWSKTGKTAPGKWSGQFNIPGFKEVKTLADFLANEDAQNAVYERHIKDIDRQVKTRGLEKYIGQTIGGTVITLDGIRYMAHLGGIGGAEKFLKSGGAHNPQDANGTALGTYAALGGRQGAGGGVNAPFSYLTSADLDKWDAEDDKNLRIESADLAVNDVMGRSESREEAYDLLEGMGLEPQVLALARDRLSQEYRIKDQNQEAEREETRTLVLDEVLTAVEAGDYETAMKAIPEDMHPEDRAKMKLIVRQGKATTDNQDVLDGIYELKLGSAEDRRKFQEMDLRPLIGELTKGTLDDLARQQASMKAAGAKGDISLGAASAMFNRMMNEIGIQTSGDDISVADLRFRRRASSLAMRALDQKRAELGRELNNSETQDVIDDVFMTFKGPEQNAWFNPNSDTNWNMKDVFERFQTIEEKEGLVPGSLLDQAIQSIRKQRPNATIDGPTLMWWMGLYRDKTGAK